MIDQKILKGLKLDKFVVFDTETTGLNSYSDKLIEIAGVKYEGGKITDVFTSLIDPEVYIDDKITALTGISNDDVAGQEKVDTVIPKFLNFVDGYPLVAHNISFDLEFITYNIAILDLENKFKTKKFYDTLILSQTLLPVGVSNHKLGTLAECLNIEVGNLHRAKDDCEACGSLFLKLIEKAVTLSDNTVQKLATVAAKSMHRYTAQFFKDLGDYYSKTSFNRKLNAVEIKYPESHNYYDKDEEFPEENLSALFSEGVVDNIFSNNGVLKSNIAKYEYRSEQHEMAKKCFEVFSQDRILISEAGTGVGKSYAYLIPSIIHSLKSNQKVIVSTNTKNLQEQIFYKDIPVLYDIFKGAFNAVVLKGRRNYLCRNRFEALCRDPLYHLKETDIEKLLPLIVWAEKTNTGDIEENSGFKKNYAYDIWSKVESESGFCMGKKCRYYKQCFLQTIRNKVFKANLVIINHSLLFSDVISENAILGKYDYLVVDEAHNIEASATKYLGVEYSLYGLRGFCSRLVSSDGKSGNLIRLKNGVNSVLSGDQKKTLLNDLIDSLKDKSNNLYEAGRTLFDEISINLYEKNSVNRFHKILKKRFRSSAEVFADYGTQKLLFKSLNEEVVNLLRRIKVLLDTFDEDDRFPDQDEIISEFKSISDIGSALYEDFLFFDETKRENYVFWYEITSADKGFFLKLCSAPLNVSQILQKTLYDNLKGIILTSATLTIEKRFKYMMRKLGLTGMDNQRIDTLMLGSPFDLQQQLKVVTPSYFATPKNTAVFENDLTELLDFLVTKFDQGTLALFTSYKQMNDIKYRIDECFRKNNRLLLVQGKDGSRTDIIKQFKRIKNSFLFGTDSFWEGVDVPGEALEALIIVKLPFAVPTEPVIQARIEAIEKKGKNSFMFYSVPEAILKFKQGVGRLIRSETDRGVVYVLDSRVVNTRWGQAFVNSLPVKPVVARKLAEVAECGKIEKEMEKSESVKELF